MAAGLLLGGALSLLNEQMLWSSVGAIFNLAQTNEHQRAKRRAASGFLLRYLIIAIIAVAAAYSGWVDISGLGIGMAAFIVAVMIEASRQLLSSFRKMDEGETDDEEKAAEEE